MSTIHSEDQNRLTRVTHRILHEIEERTDTNVDTVADIIDLWETLKDERMTRHE